MSHPSVYPTNSAEFFTRILSKMEGRANELSIKGVAVVAFYHPGKEFLSQMRVVGCMRNDEANYLAIAYSKIAEMCDTLQASGGRKALLGEFGYIGGAIQKGEGFYYLAAFSGASGLEDLEVSRCGLSSL